MKYSHLPLLISLTLLTTKVAVGQIKVDLINWYEQDQVQQINCSLSKTRYQDKNCIKVIDTGVDTSLKFVKLLPSDFKNGTIEIEVSGKPGVNASVLARGFVGIAFRIAPDNGTFECIYLRPSNARANDQIRRNHSVQYISYPNHPWHKLRKEEPEKYEAYVDLVPGEWTKFKIVVKDEKARLYVHGNTQPTLVINDLKLGTGQSGAIGLWIGPGTEAHFTNLVIKKEE